ncbi:hypothetical protein FY528_20935 [Hymenobacter lutimineralis]|uniref:Outer membrane protein assembly factor BamE n=1 Tax=Hymenobacter lutimineralis TaxID=2606448 RepID=A0A5D6URT1_9BACT|nr:hypothetical protein [Hymenobacter lutimineralis]TYZ05770.1 hypothetical protein FY528_20935 [Hymenobacter lutimineralis]
MKKSTVGFGIILLFILALVYNFTLSPLARKGKMHQKESYKIVRGMTKKEVFSIMGPYDKRLQQKDYTVFLYEPHQFASSEVAITFGQDSLVKTVNHGD